MATDFAGSTLATDDPDIRVFIGAGVLLSRFTIFAALADDVVEAFWIVIDTDQYRLTAQGVISRPTRSTRPVAGDRRRPTPKRPVADIVSEQRR